MTAPPAAIAELLDYLTPEERAEVDHYAVKLTAGRALTEYQHDPIRFAVERLGISEATIQWSLSPEYQEHQWDGTADPLKAMAEALAEWNDVGVESGTGTGKSFWVAVLILWFLACFEDALAFTFAPTEKQLTKYIWKEIGKLWPKFHALFPEASLTQLQIRMRGGIDETWGAAGFPVGVEAGADISTKAAGMHAEHMLLVYEETPGIPPQVIEAGENTCTAPHNLRIAIGNPNHRLDALHKFCTSPGVRHVRMSGLDHPNVVTGNPSFIPGAVSAVSIERRRAKYGEASPNYQSRVRGMSPEQPADALIRLEWLEAAHKRYMERRAANAIPRIVTGKGIDVANSEHGDRGAVCDFAENVVIRLEAKPCPDGSQLARDEIVQAKRHNLPSHRVGCDPIGVGASPMNESRRLQYPFQGLNFGAAPVVQAARSPDGSRYEWAPDANLFQNFRGQCYWQAREDLQAGVIDMAKDEELWEELLAMTFDDESKVVKLPPKDDLRALLGRSPDKADAFVMANWVRERQVVEPTKPEVPEGRSLGYDYKHQKPRERESAESIFDKANQGGSVTATRYRLPHR